MSNFSVRNFFPCSSSESLNCRSVPGTGPSSLFKERLLKKYDVNILDDYDFWLIQENQYPDYPYVFTMWQYGLATEINGIPGNVLVNISFIDFTIK